MIARPAPRAAMRTEVPAVACPDGRQELRFEGTTMPASNAGHIADRRHIHDR